MNLYYVTIPVYAALGARALNNLIEIIIQGLQTSDPTYVRPGLYGSS